MLHHVARYSKMKTEIYKTRGNVGDDKGLAMLNFVHPINYQVIITTYLVHKTFV